MNYLAVAVAVENVCKVECVDSKRVRGCKRISLSLKFQTVAVTISKKIQNCDVKRSRQNAETFERCDNSLF